jgi:hypothetical protein
LGVEVDHRADTRLGWGAGAVVLLAGLGPAVWALMVSDRLPSEVARHWGFGGEVTGTWPVTSQVLVLGTITVAVAAACAGVAVVGRQPLAVRRMLAGAGVWTAVVLGTGQVAALVGQLDLDDPFQAPSPGAGIAAGAVLGVVLAVGVASLAREPAHAVLAEAPPPGDLPRLPEEVDDQATGDPEWRGAPATSRASLVVAGAVLAGCALPLLVGTWWPLVLGATVLVPVVGLTRFHVEVDGDGVVARSGPMTLLRVPLEQVAGADVVEQLDPFWEFGGWGLRVDVHGRTGLVSRAGEALSVARADGSEVVVTVEDAAGAAATLNTLADRRLAP